VGVYVEADPVTRAESALLLQSQRKLRAVVCPPPGKTVRK